MKKLFFILGLMASAVVLAAVPQIQSVQGELLLTGKKTVVDAVGKKGLVVVFLSARCPCSNSHNAELTDLSQTYKDFNFVVIHSNAGEGKDLSRPYFAKANFPFPVIEDQKAALAEQLNAFKTPHAYLFSAEGKVLYQGGMSNSRDLAKAERKYLREALEDVQAAKDVRTPDGRTLGCFISRGS